MIYKKEEVIKKGNNAIILKRKELLLAGFVFLGIAVLFSCYFIVSIIIDKKAREANNIAAWVAFIVVLFLFSLLFMLIRKKKKYDPLLEGCKAIEIDNRKYVDSINREIKENANKIAKKTHKTIRYSVHENKFKSEELFELFKESDSVEYLNYVLNEEDKKQLIKESIIIPKTKKPTNNHTFDDYFSDEEFDDLMDD